MSFNNRIRALYSLSVLSTSAFLLAKITRAEKDEANVRTQQPPSPRIAVVGGGIGGTSSAYFLRELFGEAAQIDVYEPGSIGGRVASVLVGDRKYECGASIIHPRNKYMVQHAEKFGLKHRKDVTVLMGSYDGKEFVFEESSWGFITILKMLWQYGWRDLFGLQREVNKMLKSFDSIYDFQENGRCFTTVRDMMQAMGGDDFDRMTMSPADQMLREMKFSELFISQVVSLATRVNYGQEPNMEAFAAFVSLAGVQPGLWAVDGGNELLPQNFLAKSNSTVINSTVTSITLHASNKLETNSTFSVTSSSEGNSQTHNYDMVIIATPLVSRISSIQFNGFPTPIGPYPGEYRSTVATFAKGTVNKEEFGRSKDEFIPGEILTTQEIPLGIRSVSKTFPIDFKGDSDKDNFVYKVFSTDVPTEKQMSQIFSSYSNDVYRAWLAYPYYRNVDIDTVAPFQLYPGLFYVNAIEWAASAMEMSAIGAKNSALLAKKHWSGGGEESVVVGSQKIEL